MEDLVSRYRSVVVKLNEIAEGKKPRERSASGADSVPLEAHSLIAERSRLSAAIADEIAGVSFSGWRK